MEATAPAPEALAGSAPATDDDEELEWLTLVDVQFEADAVRIRDELKAAAPPTSTTTTDQPQTSTFNRPTLRIEGATGHAALINGEYAEEKAGSGSRLVLTNCNNGGMLMWAEAGRWCVGRRKNVGTVRCRAFVQSEPASGRPEDIPRSSKWMINDGVHATEFTAAAGVGVRLVALTPHRARPARQLGVRSAAADERLAALLAAATAGKQVVDGIDVPDGGVWGPASNAALRAALGAGLRPASLRLSGSIHREEDAVELAELVSPDCGLAELGMANCMVGPDGLRAVVAAARRCRTLRGVDLFNVGPRTESWESLGCFTRGPECEDCVLLLELHRLLRGRHAGAAYVLNEAFMDDCHGGGALLGLLE